MKFLFTLLSLILIPASFIFSQNIKVSDPVKLCSNYEEFYNSPVFSPDGSNIAFTSSNYKGLFVFNVQSKNISVLTQDDAAGFGFKWDITSQNIVSRPAKFENDKRFNTIKVYNLESKKSTQLCDYRSLMPGLPGFTPDNSKVYICSRGILEFFPSGLPVTTDSKNLTNSFAFIKDDMVSVSNSNNTPKTFDVKNGEKVINLTISPDGKKVAFEILGGNMYSMNIDGSDLTDLGVGNRPAWSNDNTHIAYIITKDDGYNYTESDIYVIKADGTGKQNLTDSKDILEMNPCFAPDNKSIIFDIPTEGAIYSMNISIN